MEAAELARRVAMAPSHSAARTAMRDALDTGHSSFFQIARYALDPAFVPSDTVPSIEEDDGGASGFTDMDFVALLAHNARHPEDIREAAMAAPAETWNRLYRPLLLGLPPKGMDAIAINAVLGDDHAWRVPVPGFQQPTRTRSLPRGYGWLVDAYPTGQRALCVPRRDGSPCLVSEHGRPIMGAENLLDACHGLYRLLAGPLILEGFVSPGSGNGAAKVDPDFTYWLIEAFPAIVYPSRPCELPQSKRHEILCALEMSGVLRQVRGIRVLPKVEVDLGTPEGRSRIGVLRRDAAAVGHRGIVLKDPAAPYVAGVSRAWRALEGAG
jgi:hypothetical protein